MVEGGGTTVITNRVAPHFSAEIAAYSVACLAASDPSVATRIVLYIFLTSVYTGTLT